MPSTSHESFFSGFRGYDFSSASFRLAGAVILLTFTYTFEYVFKSPAPYMRTPGTPRKQTENKWGAGGGATRLFARVLAESHQQQTLPHIYHEWAMTNLNTAFRGHAKPTKYSEAPCCINLSTPIPRPPPRPAPSLRPSGPCLGAAALLTPSPSSLLPACMAVGPGRTFDRSSHDTSPQLGHYNCTRSLFHLQAPKKDENPTYI